TFEKAAREHPTVLVPAHRSHLDYILIGVTLFRSNLNTPVVAAGVNLRFWPIGFLIRSAGAFFVKRGNNDLLDYLVLRRYVTYLVKRGHLQEFFIEGGRSRSGKMRRPKLGLLTIIMEAYFKQIRRDITFVPVSLTYENVVEDKVYGTENTRKKKEKENLHSLLKARGIFRRKYGEVLIHLGEPISLSDYSTKRSENRSGKSGSQRQLISDFANELTDKIRLGSSVSLTSLACTALLMSPSYGLQEDKLRNQIAILAQHAELFRRFCPGAAGFTSTLEKFIGSESGSIDALTSGGLIKNTKCSSETVYFIP
ncbi:MAG: glycerol-3-phosphate acyltransferase, partial [Bdellovibrionales bacterium]|nr:glycerol-3-phosphate acyltransferase [Bdellovibrionales bacterium]